MYILVFKTFPYRPFMRLKLPIKDLFVKLIILTKLTDKFGFKYIKPLQATQKLF